MSLVKSIKSVAACAALAASMALAAPSAQASSYMTDCQPFNHFMQICDVYVWNWSTLQYDWVYSYFEYLDSDHDQVD